MEFFIMTLVYLLLAPIFLGWLMITMGPLVFFIIALVYLLKISDMEAEILEPNLILVVDDELQSVLPLITLLEKAKVPFTYAKNGVEAINELSKRHFRLIFMDFYMPQLSGLETLTKADRVISELYPPTPVIFYSGKDDFSFSPTTLRHLSIIDRWNKSMNAQNLWSRLDHLLALNPS